MRIRVFGEKTYYSAMAWGRLGKPLKAKALLRALLGHARELATTRATIDYFATSLPAMLLFDDDLQFRQETTARFLEAQAQWGLDRRAQAKRLLGVVLKRDPNHAPAADFADGIDMQRIQR
jgi:hypothetical protein